MAAIDISKLVQESIANIASSSIPEPTTDIDTDALSSKMIERLEEGSKSYASIVASKKANIKAQDMAKDSINSGIGTASVITGMGGGAYAAKKIAEKNYKDYKANNPDSDSDSNTVKAVKKAYSGTKLAGADSTSVAKKAASGAKLAGADSTSVAKKAASGAKLAGVDSTSVAKKAYSGTKLAGADSTKSSTTMDKLRSVGSHAKETAKELYGQFSNSPKAQMVAGGTAAALGAGLAAKRYMQRKKAK